MRLMPSSRLARSPVENRREERGPEHEEPGEEGRLDLVLHPPLEAERGHGHGVTE